MPLASFPYRAQKTLGTQVTYISKKHSARNLHKKVHWDAPHSQPRLYTDVIRLGELPFLPAYNKSNVFERDFYNNNNNNNNDDDVFERIRYNIKDKKIKL